MLLLTLGEVKKMNINLIEYIHSTKKFAKVWESACKNHRILYFQLNKEDEGIAAHFHPYGEDSALVLQGELTYDISFDQQIVASENNVLFGWTNNVHGYHNVHENPLHILVFATPENNPSEYKRERLPKQSLSQVRIIDVLANMSNIESPRMLFSTMAPTNFTNCISIHLESKILKVLNPFENNPPDEDGELFITFK
jgi:mannose-6-phosphate isomerase-like protein (cupin superfamily)